jgi:hypothetical protein
MAERLSEIAAEKESVRKAKEEERERKEKERRKKEELVKIEQSSNERKAAEEDRKAQEQSTEEEQRKAEDERTAVEESKAERAKGEGKAEEETKAKGESKAEEEKKEDKKTKTKELRKEEDERTAVEESKAEEQKGAKGEGKAEEETKEEEQKKVKEIEAKQGSTIKANVSFSFMDALTGGQVSKDQLQHSADAKMKGEKDGVNKSKRTFIDALMGSPIAKDAGQQAQASEIDLTEVREDRGNFLKGKGKIDEGAKGGEGQNVTEGKMSAPDIMKRNLPEEYMGIEMDEKRDLEMSEKFKNLIDIKGKNKNIIFMVGPFLPKCKLDTGRIENSFYRTEDLFLS